MNIEDLAAPLHAGRGRECCCWYDARRARLRRRREPRYASSIRAWKLRAQPRPATPAPIARWLAASSCIPRAIWRRARTPKSFTSRAIPIIRPIAARCARKARRCSISCTSKTRTLYPQIRKPGSDKFERVSWDVALDRVARLMKDDRDKNFIAKNTDGVTVNRWLSTGFPRGLGNQQ